MTQMVNYVCAKSPRFHQIASNKRSKVKISPGEHAPGPPSLPHALHTNMCLLPPNNLYNLILPPLGQKLKETLVYNVGISLNGTLHCQCSRQDVHHSMYE